MSDESQLLAANAAFYEAFARGDGQAMDAVWAANATCTCTHPGWRTLRGRAAVMASWTAILATPPPITCSEPIAQVFGDVGVVLCTEHLGEGTLAATNVFVREAGRWRMVHHHAGPIHAAPDETRTRTTGGY